MYILEFEMGMIYFKLQENKNKKTHEKFCSTSRKRVFYGLFRNRMEELANNRF